MARSPRRRIPLASVAAGLKAERIPVGLRQASGGLTPATGARTTRFCRPQSAMLSSGALCSLTESIRPANILRARALPRPPHPAPYVRDDRDTPLWWDGMAGILVLICPTALSGIFFARGLDRFWRDLPVRQSHMVVVACSSSFSPCGRRWIAGAKRQQTDEGSISADAEPLDAGAPLPTFSHKGRRGGRVATLSSVASSALAPCPGGTGIGNVSYFAGMFTGR